MNEGCPRFDDDADVIVVAVNKPVKEHGVALKANSWRCKLDLVGP
jgi:hypothetical protein